MATNVTQKDKTLNEIIDMCVEKRVHYRQFLNDFMLTHSEDWHDSADVTYGERIMFLRGKIQAFDECAACCESMLGRTAPPTNAEIEAVAKRLCWNSCEWDGIESDCVAKDEDDAWNYAGEIPGFQEEYIRQAKELLALARRAVTE